MAKERYEKVFKFRLKNPQSTIIGESMTQERIAEIILEELKNPKRIKKDNWAEKDKWEFIVIEFSKEQKRM